MTRRLWALLAVVLIAASVWYVARPSEHVPPYDAMLNRLAESELEAYCTGLAFWRNKSPNASAAAAARCREIRSKDLTVSRVRHIRLGSTWKVEAITVTRDIPALSSEPNISTVPGVFCQAMEDGGFDSGVPLCVVILGSNDLWPTYDGWITGSWSDKFPYPSKENEQWWK